MIVRVRKIGGRLAVLIPSSLARELNLVDGTPLEIASDAGSLLLRKKRRRATRSMAALVAAIKPGSYKRRSQEHRDIIGDPPSAESSGEQA